MAKEIKQKITLEGEKQYNQAIKEAQRNLKTLKSELKAETAELGKNATEQQKTETRAKSLKQQIAEQEKIVKTLREALEEAKKEYGDNADVVQSWEQKLNGARTTLANMKNDLDSVGQSFGGVQANAAQATVATKSVADALGSIGSASDSVAGAIENIFTGMISAVTDAVEQLWDLIGSTAAKANQWTDIAGYWNTDPQKIQQYARAVGASANSFEDLQSAVSKLVLGGKGKDITSLIGVSGENYKDQWDYAMAVMDRLSQMKAEGADMTSIYEKIFGEKKSTKVMNLLNDWETIQELLPQFNGNESGYGMDNQELDAMNNLWVQMNTIEAKWEALKDNVAAGLGTSSMELLLNVEGTLDGLAEYMAAGSDEEREAALGKIRQNIEEFFTKLAETIRQCIGILDEVGAELQESDDPLTKAIGSILSGVVDALEWMINNADKVQEAFEIIFGAWLIAKLGSVAASLSEILLQIETIKAFKGISLVSGAGGAESLLGGAGLAGAGEAISAAITESLGPIAGSVAGIAASIAGGLMIAGFAAGALAVIGRLIKGESPEETAARETVENAAEVGKQMEAGGAKVAPEVKNEVGKGILEAIFTGDASRLNNLAQQQRETEVDTIAAEAAAAVEALPQTQVESGGPTGIFNRRGRLDATAEQQAAAEAYWDILRSGNWGEGDADLDNAWDAMAAAFGGEGSALFGRLDTLLQRLVDEHSQAEENADYNPAQWMDIPSTWWQNPGGGDSGMDNGVTGEDLAGLRALPGAIEKSVKSGAAAGVSGIKVSMDGYAVGEVVAPYVSEIIARGMD